MGLTRVTPDEAIANWPNRYRAHFFNCLSGFKALHLLGTTNGEGQYNLAAFSQVVHIGAKPPYLGIVFRPHTVERHSLENLEKTGAFTLNHVHNSFVEKAHQTAAKYPQGTSEFDEVGLTPILGSLHNAPYVEEATIRIGLEKAERIDIQSNGTIFIIGRVTEVWYPESCVKQDGFLNLQEAGSVTCTGMDAYFNPVGIARLAYAEPEIPVRPLPEDLNL